MRRFSLWCTVLSMATFSGGCGSEDLTNRGTGSGATVSFPKVLPLALAPDLALPVALEADGKPIDIGRLTSNGHASPCLMDVDGDGDRDLLVGDFPGYFWLFDNNGTDVSPQYAAAVKLQAGGEDAKTPVY